MTVIEVRGRGGQLIERVRCHNEQINIGRAFDNDVIIADPYVSAHHLRLQLHQQGWLVEDLASENGVRYQRQTRDETEHVQSGDQLRIGHTELHIYHDEHPVGQALKIDSGEVRLAFLGRHFIWSFLLVVSCVILLLSAYQHSFSEYKLLPILQPVLWSVLGVAIIAAIWALVGRLIKHRTYFPAHLSIWFLFGLGLQFAEYCAGVIGYNASSGMLQIILSKSLNFFLLLVAIGASITLATTLLSNKRLWISVGAAGLLLSFQLAGEVQWDRDFSSSPKYYAQLQSPGLLWVEPEDEAIISEQLPDLLERAVAEMERIRDAE